MPSDTARVRDNEQVVVTKLRNMRIEDDLWDGVKDTAARQGEGVTDVVKRALRAYVADPNAFDAAIAQIRGAAQ